MFCSKHFQCQPFKRGIEVTIVFNWFILPQRCVLPTFNVYVDQFYVFMILLASEVSRFPLNNSNLLYARMPWKALIPSIPSKPTSSSLSFKSDVIDSLFWSLQRDKTWESHTCLPNGLGLFSFLQKMYSFLRHPLFFKLFILHNK